MVNTSPGHWGVYVEDGDGVELDRRHSKKAHEEGGGGGGTWSM